MTDTFSADILLLSPDRVTKGAANAKSRMMEKFGEEEVEKRLPPDDWARWSIVADWVATSPSLLDVGTAHGTFVNTVAAINGTSRIAGIDVRDYPLYSDLFRPIERTLADAEEMPFDDAEFHTVTCMEVIEHLEDGKMEAVIKQLRRVAGVRLIVSVPFCEGYPLYKGHFQRFSPDRVKLLFPEARYTLFIKEKKGSTPWLIIDEVRA